MRIIANLLACALVVGSAQLTEGSAPESELFAPDFALLDPAGRQYQLKRTDARAVVLFFTANGCPVARQSVRRLQEIEERFGAEGVAVWMVNANTGDSAAEIREEAKEFHIDPIPVLIDEAQGVAAALGVRRTGTVVAIATGNARVFYVGAVDDQLSEGAQKPKATEKYLEVALTQFLSGEQISTPRTTARGCLIAFDRPEDISYAKDVAPILARACVTCHSPGNIGPFSMDSYRRVRGMSEMIREVVLARRMPPWNVDRAHGEFHNDLSLTPEETRTLLGWIEQGAPRGEGEDPLDQVQPSRPEWVLGGPDVVVQLPEVQDIPANGVLEYRYIRVPVPFEEDTWIGGVVAQPDNNRVVHHIIVRVKEPGQRRDREDDAFLIGWAPGATEMKFPEGTGKLIPKGMELEFEMHYTTSGRPEKDQSRIGLYVLKERPRYVLRTHAAVNTRFEIPPKQGEVTAFATYVFRRDGYLYDMSPHMHLRGSWFKFEALYPSGEREVLLSVPQYDFKWQHTYLLKEPKRMPAGTYILCSGGFDNSKLNPHNPDPGKRVTWGEQSWDEMFIGFINVAEITPEPVASAN